MQVKEASLTLNPDPFLFNHEEHEEKRLTTKITKEEKVTEGRALPRPSCMTSQSRMRN